MTTETTTVSEPHQNAQQKKELNSNSSSPQSLSSNSSLNKSELSNDQQLSTVIPSPLSDPNIKFPLENSWSFWFYKNEKSKDWKDNVKFITTVDFVEDFWGVYNHLQLVSKLSAGCDYMFFKKDIPPMWEDPQNLDGGRWVLNLEKKQKSSTSPLDVYWLNTLLALIGDQFMDESPYVNGVWVNIRARGDKLSLWTKSAKSADIQMKIGRKFREILALKDSSLTYEVHGDDQKKVDTALYRV